MYLFPSFFNVLLLILLLEPMIFIKSIKIWQKKLCEIKKILYFCNLKRCSTLRKTSFVVKRKMQFVVKRKM